ncbi:zinc finger protein 691-like [Phyllopteryx taeniolatus]|uniref:zinc finger protein 691-like n=1 Tax=Phyllopteryx taeniolatus TaxID=161469 RepID=UPI002AD2BEF2|nr:zinc finger protein 691-like [Phyllopteryx taeniolatus]
MCARRTPEYEEELCGPKEENEPQHQLLDAIFNLQPRIVLHRADVSRDLRPEWPKPDSSHVKEEEEDKEVCHIKEEEDLKPRHIKEEEEEFLHVKQEEIIQVPVTGVSLKSEDEGQSEESRGAEPPSSSSSRHMTTEGDGDRCGGSPADGLLAPLSDSDDMTSHSPRTDDDDDDDDDDDKQSEGGETSPTDNKRWKCSQCGKTFYSKGQLKEHMRSHTGEKPFACTVCGQRFSQKVILSRHTRTHTVKKYLTCSVCGQRFTKKGDLTSHTRTHNGEKPFACSVCGQTFSAEANLKVHTRTHTGDKPFACSDCGQRFSIKGTLKKHTRTHTGEKPFPAQFVAKDSLRREP